MRNHFFFILSELQNWRIDYCEIVERLLSYSNWYITLYLSVFDIPLFVIRKKKKFLLVLINFKFILIFFNDHLVFCHVCLNLLFLIFIILIIV